MERLARQVVGLTGRTCGHHLRADVFGTLRRKGRRQRHPIGLRVLDANFGEMHRGHAAIRVAILPAIISGVSAAQRCECEFKLLS